LTNFTLTIDAAFTNGATAGGDSMQASHWTTPLGEVETLLQGRVGRDGVGIDNWNGNSALRGVNFREGGLGEIFRRTVQGENWNVTRGAASPGELPTPGGTTRFYLRETADLWICYSPRIITTVAAAGAVIPIAGALDDAALGANLNAFNPPSGSYTFTPIITWESAAVAAGWHSVRHGVLPTASPGVQLVFGRTDLVVVAAYQ